ncbi:MAG: hypothetical protein RMJ67_03835 [Elusimicrobiota bacterium]|nr:hypothetical protein [Endomicrobiia bacterium]MDW8165621.1 hypothetical protein [Elusimicrobiota bacterium]
MQVASFLEKNPTQQFLFSLGKSFTKKEKILLSYKTKNEKYKRYLGSTLRSNGGKSCTLGDVIENLNLFENIKRIIFPFFASGYIKITIAK